MAETPRYSMLFEFAKISAMAMITGLVSVCVAGTAMASDSVPVDTAPVVPVEISNTQTTSNSSVSELTLLTTTDATTPTTQLTSQIDASNQPSNGTTGDLNAAGSTSNLLASNASIPTEKTTIIGVALPTSTDITSVSPMTIPAINQTPAAIDVAKRAARLEVYQAIFDRSNEAQNSLNTIAYVPPVVSDNQSGPAVPGTENAPVPVKTTGLLGDFSLAIGSVFVPNSINYVLDASRHASDSTIWVLYVLLMTTIFAQGFILFVRRAGYTRAPRAGIGSSFTFATPQLMSHFVPI